MSKNLLIKNSISKNYFKNNLYLGDKIRLNKIIKNIFNRLDDNKNNLHILSKKLDLQLNQRILKKFSK